MRISSRLVLPLFALLAIPLPVRADPITVVSASQSILVQAHAGPVTAGPDVATNAQPLSDSVTAASGGQTGTAEAVMILSDEPDVLLGAGGGVNTSHDSTSLDAGGHAEATNSIDFILSVAQQFILSATFATGLQDANNRSSWDVALSSLDGSSPGFHLTGSNSINLLTDGILQPGRYRFSLDAFSDTSGTGSGRTRAAFNFAFGLNDVGAAATPEPASMLLLGTGLVALVTHRGRQKRSA